VLQQGSMLYHANSIGGYDIEPLPEAQPPAKLKKADSKSKPKSKSKKLSGDIDVVGSTTNAVPLPRERFSYRSLDLLFSICSDKKKDEESLRRRIAALCLPTLLQRCGTTLSTYLADDAIRGSYPLPRVREEELVHVLGRLLELRLWPGSLWAALSSSPTKHSSEQPAIDSV